MQIDGLPSTLFITAVNGIMWEPLDKHNGDKTIQENQNTHQVALLANTGPPLSCFVALIISL